MEGLGQGERRTVLSVDELGKYCSAMAVEERLQTLVERDVIDEENRMTLLAKYAECVAAAADFEDTLYLLLPLIRGDPLEPEAGQAVVFQTGALGEDETMRGLVALLLRFGLEERRTPGVSVVVLDKGRGRRESLFNFLKELSPCVSAHLFTEDVFTLADHGNMAALLSRFSVRIYGRHLAMSSVEKVERACGEIDVVKNSYNVAYDRRWSANRPWDVLLGRSKTESYTRSAPVREPRYRKEMILNFPPGTGIVECMGNSMLFAI